MRALRLAVRLQEISAAIRRLMSFVAMWHHLPSVSLATVGDCSFVRTSACVAHTRRRVRADGRTDDHRT